jgi:predicted nucleic acid-binding protein
LQNLTAGFIITGDRDLLEIGVFHGTKILQPKEFLEQAF